MKMKQFWLKWIHKKEYPQPTFSSKPHEQKLSLVAKWNPKSPVPRGPLDSVELCSAEVLDVRIAISNLPFLHIHLLIL